MVLSGLSFVAKSGVFYSYLVGNSALLQTQAQDSVQVFKDTVFGNVTLNKILFLVFWMLIGLLVYLLLSSIGSTFGSAEKARQQAGFVHAQKDQIVTDLKRRLVLRTMACLLIILYSTLFFRVVLPFGIYNSRIVAGNLTQVSAWLYGLLGFCVLAVGLYIFVVLTRFLLLRPRVWGGWQDSLQEKMRHRMY